MVPGYSHHVVQRGVRSLEIFFEEQEQGEYLNFLRRQGDRFGIKFLTYCLMTNHVHLLAIPKQADSLARAIGEVHCLYTRMINFREGTRGYLFLGQDSSCPVSTDSYLLTAVQYIFRNPVKAKIVTYPWEYKWSSASYHCGLESHDLLIQGDDFLSGVVNWQELLCTDSEMGVLPEEKNRTGRPFGTDEFYAIVEKLTGRDTRPGRPGHPMQQSKKE